ncbi:MAG: hypothetical protein ACTS3T_10800 [Almyronema sp.]|uniref:Uncharacterized protein n=1 Tax=Almyronema epifaneia S1 TaxID=2991925 RepID=A0ABW6IJT3_9CYAN
MSRLNAILTSGNSLAAVEVSTAQETSERLRLAVLRQLPSFGFNNLVADWAFLNFLQYFGDDAVREQVGYTISPYYFEVIVEKDPRFIEPYLYLSNSVSMYAAQPNVAVALMDKGLPFLKPQVPPKSYLVWRYKGIDELLFLGDGEAAQKSFALAADWAEASSDPQSNAVAEASRNTAEFLARNPSSKAAQVSAWASILVRAVDDRTRAIAIRNIESLGGTITADQQGRVTVDFRLDD